MLKNTFLHISGIGIKTEQRFWESGIHNWNDFTSDYPIRLSPKGWKPFASTCKNQNKTLNPTTQVIFQNAYRSTSTGGFSLNSETLPLIWILKQPG